MRTKKAKFFIPVLVFIVLGLYLQDRCPSNSELLDIKVPFGINRLYPWPDAKIPFACHLFAHIKSPFTPGYVYYHQSVLKEDGMVLPGTIRPSPSNLRRSGVFTADVVIDNKNFPEYSGEVVGLPLYEENFSFYVDNKGLQIGHISWAPLDLEFRFATILNPILFPGKHTGKVVLKLPSGNLLTYEWEFYITWW